MTCFFPLLILVKSREAQPEKTITESSIPWELSNMPVEQLNLSVRTMNCLRRGNIQTVGEVVGKGEKGLMTLRNFGVKSLQELDDRLGELGLKLIQSENAGETAENEAEKDEEAES